MPKNLLAVDDSTTMRKVLEITFSGEDFQVSGAADRAGCMAKLGEHPSVVVIDTSLEGDDGYAICREVRGKVPRAVIVMMASRYNPYDAAKGKDAGADDYVDKPFDTQQMIDKVKKLLAAKESAPEAAAPPIAAAPPVAAAPMRAPSPAAPPVAARPVASPPSPPVAPAPPKPFTPGAAPARSGTLMFSVDGPPMPAPPQTSSTAQTAAPPPAPLAPPVRQPEPPAAAAAPPAAPTPPAAAAAVNGHMAPKLAAMGLSPAQAEAVMALSREVVERVVWEVVPQLAEAMIKEEIARLTKEG